MPDPPLSLSDKSPKQQRLARAKAILHLRPNLTRNEIARLIAQEMSVDRTTAYAYIREIKEAQPNANTEADRGERNTDNAAPIKRP